MVIRRKRESKGKRESTEQPEASKEAAKKSNGAEEAAAKENDGGAAEAEKGPTGAALPLFYRRPAALTPERHKTLGLTDTPNFRFARATNSVPILASEFALAAKFYPIVFAEGDPASPVAVVGIRASENLFIDADGRWEEDHYVPAYIRRYPFVFGAGPTQEQFVLCIDEESDLIVTDSGRPFFADGKPTELTQQALKFCSSFPAQSEFTKNLSRALAQAGLLTHNHIEAKLQDGEQLKLRGFAMIDAERFKNLDDKKFLDWRTHGWLPLIYAQIISQSNWRSLVNRASRAAAREGKA